MHQFDLKNRTAIITGGAQGFGLDIAKRFLDSGAKVIIWDIDERELIKASKELNNINLSYNIVDVSNFSKVKELRNNLKLICSLLCEKISSINKRLDDIEAKNES